MLSSASLAAPTKEKLYAWQMAAKDRLRAAREEVDLSQGDVGKHFGISYQAVAQWESGRTRPSTERLTQLARLYQRPVEELIAWFDEEKQSTDPNGCAASGNMSKVLQAAGPSGRDNRPQDHKMTDVLVSLGELRGEMRTRMQFFEERLREAEAKIAELTSRLGNGGGKAEMPTNPPKARRTS